MNKLLADILHGIEYSSDHDVRRIEINSLATDSRKVTAGSLFICVQGFVSDGHNFVAQAAAQGAVAIVANLARRDSLPRQTLPVLWVADTRQAIGHLAAAFYDHPSAGLTMIGLTGTNGKTTTSYLLEAIIRAAGGSPGIIGTINYRYGGQEFAAPFTTPEPLELQALLRQMADAGVSHVVMEVSSHALALHRVDGLSFDCALFTNLTRDHLDFHPDMEAYYQAKKLLFTDYLRPDGTAVILIDGQEADWGGRLHEELRPMARKAGQKCLTCGLGGGCDVAAHHSAFGINQTAATITIAGEEFTISSNLVGAFNLKNILGAAGVALGLGIDPQVIRRALAEPIRVPGRLESMTSGGMAGQPTVFVDYAHTPDALHNVLTTLRQLQPKRLVVVFGCGGDRDPGKRQMMGEIAGRLADVVILTADNSRSEATETILQQIEQGVLLSGQPAIDLGQPASSGYTAIADRSQAIATAIGLAHEGDIVLLSGKGHENYQISSSGTIFFDDRLEAAQCLERSAARRLQPVTAEPRAVR